jgi:subtilase family serine protease
MKKKKCFRVAACVVAVAASLYGGGIVVLNAVAPIPAEGSYRFANFSGRPPIHVLSSGQKAPSGLTPAEIKSVYKLPSTGGHGTIAIVDAYDDATIEADLNTFSAKFGLPACTTANGCFEKHKMATSVSANSGWALEESLDVEWAHAIAPKAKILLVEAKTPSGANLLAGIDYAAARKDVVAVSLSWGGAEFSDEVSLDPHFDLKSGPVFFASSGDDGAGASWPAASPYVVGVGGTSLELSSKGTLVAESAWSGSGGGVSMYEAEPAWQHTYNIPKANGHRAIPDVAYDADPQSGYPVYKTTGKSGDGWYVVGGTSAGAPQWAAIQSLGESVSLAKLYVDKASGATLKYFRDITSGKNGTCQYYCDARARYDYVTGLGAPQTVKF